eukprot:CAMPEP_0172202944 /NCGR_PEP_ID=MMETSP1050-20130122/30975_1 /TAXON_ID=233186 /ORGANISM="Cryptomonas curvata, Strain CCAP979/52" /LENGTH=102 /DNA_ID=CAMNT_0012881035 /DNA_START=136 /DNA_END=444 /DNA_ORIENTATION=+
MALDMLRGPKSEGPLGCKALHSTEAGHSPVLLFMSDGQPDSREKTGYSEMQDIATEFIPDGLIVNTLEELARVGGGTFVRAVDGVELRKRFEDAAATLSHFK